MAKRWITILLCVIWGFLAGQAGAVGPGEPAPDYHVRLLDGRTFSRADGLGKVVILHFWASWCVPCRSEMPAIERYYRKHHGEGLELIAISMDDPADISKVREVLGHYSYPGAMAGEAQMRSYGRIWRIPLTFVVDRQGTLRLDAWGGGESGLDEASLESAVTPLLNGKPGVSAVFDPKRG
ncbi:MAG: TlpA family protein disulfide reductase [Betaproteobacteria bacterium]|nr:TlpA family protein disulfide reductase [Betaproteobacteria bacterium]MDE2131646.1 TlpA family protein disulfide reductase [Betaproteobacteria bacterium]MDE2624882.1 TlpA family protein disulfide reductase [Betaproteobacteria bacterium]